MEGTASLDRGPIVSQGRVPIGPEDTAGSLTERLAEVGGALLRRDLPDYMAGKRPAIPQDEQRATWAAKLTSADGELRFTEPANVLARRVRAMTPEPGAWTTFNGQRLGVLRASVAGGRGVQHGTFELRDGVPHVAAGAGWLRLDDVKPAGKRAMSAAEWARGLRDLAPEARLPS
jgi:methionyl-tRNA formyltransferase